jgi:hypothetical protein
MPSRQTGEEDIGKLENKVAVNTGGTSNKPLLGRSVTGGAATQKGKIDVPVREWPARVKPSCWPKASNNISMRPSA